MADSHGSLDILTEKDWKNIAFTTQDQRVEIIGANLNSLLKGIFLLFGKSSHLQAHTEIWEDIIEPTFVCINQICTVEEILFRICELFYFINNVSFSRNETQKLAITAFHGAIWFLWYWVDHFSNFIPERERIILNVHVSSLRFAMRATQPLFLESWGMNRIDQIMQRLKIKAFPEKRIAGMVEPNFFLTEGCWDGVTALTAKQKTEVLKTEFAKLPKVKLEIFGADFLLDDDDEDEDELLADIGRSERKDNEGTRVIPFPTSRILNGVSLLEEFDDILSIDTIELARQWTLVDHELFQSILLCDLLQGCFTSSSFISYETTDKLFENIRLNGTKKLVDRFNASSLWVTEMILQGTNANERARVISKFIQLAVEFQKLGNYHGLMVILTALQQGCISRMIISFDLVDKTDLTNFNGLKRLMAGAKNYASYREELNKLYLSLPFEKIEGSKGWRSYLRGVNAEEPAEVDDSNSHSIEAVVPHLAAHLGALTGIAECHTDYLSENVHLMNITKWKLCSSVLLPLFRLQTLKYHFRPLRSVISSLHKQWKPYFDEACVEGIDVAKRLYRLSEAKESADLIYSHLHPKEDTVSVKDSENSSITENQKINKPVEKIRAYDRITKFHTGDQSPEPGRLTKTNSGFGLLKRMFSVRTLQRDESISEEDSSDVEDEKESDAVNESEDEQEEEEEEEEEQNSTLPSTRSKKKNLIRSILPKFLFSK